MSLRNGNEYFRKPSGAEVGVFRRLQAHVNQFDIYLFSAQLMGGGVLLWLSYIGDSLNTHRLGVINLPLCLKGAYWGGLAAV